MKKFFGALFLSLLLAFPVQAGWKTKAFGLGLAYAARTAPSACAANPACMAAIQRTALSLTKKYGEAAVEGCFNSPKCLGLIVASAAGVVGEQNKEALSEWFTSYMGKGKGRDHRNGNNSSNGKNDNHDPEPEDERPPYTLQTGGNTVDDRVAKALNRGTGNNYHKRDWGRALEKLKSDLKVRNDHHGTIRSDGAYLDGSGRILGYLEAFLFLMDLSSKISDAYVVVQVYSSMLSVKELQDVTNFTPTETGEMGVRPRPRSVPRPANYVRLSTETLTASKDLNDHLRILRERLPDGRFTDRLDLSKVEVYSTVYWWTTEDLKFNLSTDSLVTLAQIGVDTEFNLMVDPSPISND